ncbi:unnamed protein product [Peronospora destructor]|uniref:Uncharacterized protein n=1 Tax=Peronospora destructor TaxID=86335 RepID=A0AAV0V9V9_9STRA|nr:unnamed protein product [Peronospora destructor]
MRNRGRRRGTPRAVNRTDLTVAERMKKQKPRSQLESNDSPRPQDYNQPEVLSIRWKKPRGAVVIHPPPYTWHVSEGGWVHGYFEGFGMQTFATTGDCHEGLYRKNYRHGTGTFLWANGDKYVGNWRAGKMHGTGTFFWKNGDFYDGEKNGMMHGKGKKILSSGEMINGAWRQNQVSGWGIEVFSYGDKYEGFFVKGEREGFVSTNGWAETCMKEKSMKANGTRMRSTVADRGRHLTGESSSERGTMVFRLAVAFSAMSVMKTREQRTKEADISLKRSLFEVGEFKHGRHIISGKHIFVGRLTVPS